MEAWTAEARGGEGRAGVARAAAAERRRQAAAAASRIVVVVVGGGGGGGGGGVSDCGGGGGGGGATSGAALRYGLVLWLRAETAEALAADLRALVTDNGIGVQGLRNDEVVAEVRARLSRTRWPWLLIFDNVSSASLVEQTGLLPRGCQSVGHVLITSRELPEASRIGQLAVCRAVVQVGCLQSGASLALLRTAGGEHLGVDDPVDDDSDAASAAAAGAAVAAVAAGAVLAERLGHLPLALALAAAYMRACDVSCVRYLRRLEAAAGAELLHGPFAHGYARGVAESFALSIAQLDGVRCDAATSPLHCRYSHDRYMTVTLARRRQARRRNVTVTLPLLA